MDKILGGIIGTVIGFCLAWLKEIIQNRAKIILVMKGGKIKCFKSGENSIGETEDKRVNFDDAEKIDICLVIDIFNIGKIGTGIIDISLKIEIENNIRYYHPEMILLIDDKKISDTSFNVEANKVNTIKLGKILDLSEFNNLTLKEDSFEKFKIEIIAKTIHNKEIKIKADPIAFWEIF